MTFACPHCHATTPHRIEKYCAQCRTTLPHTAYNSNRAMADGLHQCCKTCRKTHRKKEREHIRERLATDPAFAQQWHKRHAREQARWVADNKDKAHAMVNAYGAANKNKINKRRRERYAENPAKTIANNRKRKARIRGATQNDLTAAQWEAIKHAYDYRCVYCPRTCKACRRKTHKLTQEHLTPLSKRGPHTLSNVVPACISCNCRRRNKAIPKPVQPLLLV